METEKKQLLQGGKLLMIRQKPSWKVQMSFLFLTATNDQVEGKES